MPEHNVITDPEIHEPKGASTAGVDTVYVADGAGSGTWEKVTADSLDAGISTDLQADIEAAILDGTLSILEAETYVFCIIPDISTGSTLFVPIPEDSTLIQAVCVLEGAITGADATITFRNETNDELGTEVIAFTSSAAGDTYVFTPGAFETFTGPTYMKIITDGGSTDAQRLFITLHFYVTRTIPA